MSHFRRPTTSAAASKTVASKLKAGQIHWGMPWPWTLSGPSAPPAGVGVGVASGFSEGAGVSLGAGVSEGSGVGDGEGEAAVPLGESQNCWEEKPGVISTGIHAPVSGS